MKFKLIIIYTTIFLFLTGCKEIDLLKQQNEDLKNQLIELKNSVDQALNELSDLKSGQSENQGSINELNLQLQSLSAQILELMSSINNIDAENSEILNLIAQLQEKCTILSQQISALNSINSSLKSGLIFYFGFDGNFNDNSINKITSSQNKTEFSIDRFGNQSKALSFPDSNSTYGGKSSFIKLNHNSLYNSNELTFSVWIKPKTYYWPNNPIHYSSLLYRGDGDCGTTAGWRFFIGEKGKMAVELQGDSKNMKFAEANIKLNEWSHYLVTIDFNNVKFYLNGQLISSQTGFGNLIKDNCSSLGIGQSNMANGYWYNYKGDMDDFGLWNRVLSSEEIKYIYENNFIP